MNATTTFLLTAALLSALPAAAAPAELTLVEDGASRYVIVLPAEASPSERWAASELAAHLKRMSGATLRATTAKGAPPTQAILVGDGPAVRAAGVTLDLPALGSEGFVIKTAGQRLVIAGGRERGTMYGVFTFLETLGCRWFYPGADLIPTRRTIRVPAMDERQVPVLEYRDFLYGEMGDSEEAQIWRARNKVNGGFFKDNKPEYGGAWRFHTLVHSYDSLMPPGTHFAEHPTWYALRGGKRTPSQPCFSSPDAVRVIAESLARRVEEHPEWRFYTVGQNDNRNSCECDECAALQKEWGSHGGAQVAFAERVAEVVRQKHPGMPLNVPAYEWTRQPPKSLPPDQNLSITLCSIECNFAQPLAEGYPEANAAFKADIEGWSRLAPRLYIWDYTTNFTHYILPYPNYYVLAPNVKFYADHRARGIMHQGSHTTRHGQLAPLCQWVLAKAMWNPNADGRKLVEEFCRGYYGTQAGPLVLEYLNLLHAAVAERRTPIWCTRGTYLSAPYLSPELVARSEQLFRQAEAAVAKEPELLRRVQIDHIPVQYVILKRARQLWEPARQLSPGMAWEDYAGQFARVARAAGIAAVREGDSADPLYQWALDYARIQARAPGGDLPPEAQLVVAGFSRPGPGVAQSVVTGSSRLKPATTNKAIHFLQAAQLDGQVRFLKRVEGASDGWAQEVLSTGWSIQHSLGHPWDFEAGKAYRLYVRVKAAAGGPAEGTALTVGIHVADPPRTCSRTVKLGEVTGEWQVLDVGPWKPTEKGGVFYIAKGADAKDVSLDCLWLAAE